MLGNSSLQYFVISVVQNIVIHRRFLVPVASTLVNSTSYLVSEFRLEAVGHCTAPWPWGLGSYSHGDADFTGYA